MSVSAPTRYYGTLSYDTSGRGTWVLDVEPGITAFVQRIFPGADPNRAGAIRVADTPAAARDVDMVLYRHPLRIPSPSVAARLKRAVSGHRGTEAAITSILSGQRPFMHLPTPARTPRDYQYAPADMVLSTGRLLCTDDLGLGKTFEAALVLRSPDALPAVIVCQTHLPTQIMAELAETWPWLTSHVVTGTVPYRPADRPGMGGHDPDVLIVPYSRLHGWVAHLVEAGVRTVIFDEAQELRRAESKPGELTCKYAAAAQLADSCAYVMGLTNTPVYNYGEEIFSVLDVIAHGALGTREEFRRTWCHRKDGKVLVTDPAALRQHLTTEGLMLGRTRKDVGRELPEVQQIRQYVPTDPAVMNKIAGDVAALARLVLDQATDKTQRFRAAGNLDWKLRQATGVAKAPAVAEWIRMLLDSQDKPVLVGLWHRPVYDILMDRLAKYRPVMYSGSESPKQKDAAKAAFLAGESRVMLLSLRSGVGLDGLQAVTNIAVIGELDWSPQVPLQFVGRLNRDGQSDPVMAFYLVSDSGSDPTVAETLQLKTSQSEPLVRDVDLFAPVADHTDRVVQLARYVLDRAGEPLPVRPAKAASTGGQPPIEASPPVVVTHQPAAPVCEQLELEAG